MSVQPHNVMYTTAECGRDGKFGDGNSGMDGTFSNKKTKNG